MKSKRLLLALALALLVPWAANAQTLNEGFEGTTFPPDDWTTIHVTGSQQWTRSTGTGAGSSSAFALRKDVSGGYEDYLITPLLVPVTGDELSFYLASQYAYNYANTTLTIEVSTTTPEIASFTTVLATYTSGSSGNFGTNGVSDWVNKTVDVSAYVGQQIYIAFHAKDTGYNADVRIDNVSGVSLFVPACPKPAGLAATPNGQSATLTWTSDASSFHVAYSADGTANPDDLTYTTVTTNSYTKDNLALDADHYFWVRANCSGTDQSAWAGPVSVHIGYCTPAPSNVDGNGISNVTFGTGDYVVNNETPKATYADYSDLVGAVRAGVEATIAITFKTGYTYNTYVWVDLDNSLSFDADEVVCYGESTDSNPTTLTLNFTIPATQTVGDFRLRIGSADSGLGTDPAVANPCYSGSWACFQDYTLRVLEAPSCFPPTGLTVSDVTAHTANISWTSDGNAWQIGYSNDNFATEQYVEVTENPYTLPGLAPETAYQVRVQNNCGGGTYSVFTNPVSFTTVSVCQTPDGLAANDVTNNSATITWNTYGLSDFNLRYNNDSGDTITLNNVNSPYTLDGVLDSNTPYQVQVQAVCNTEAWSPVLNFRTECDAITTFPWTENFNSLTAGIPTCWDNSEGTTIYESYKWNYYATGHYGAGLLFNSYFNSSGNTNFLKTPTLSLPSNQPMQLSFWYKNPTGGDFSVYISTDGGDTHETALATGLTGVSTWTELVISLADYAGQEVVIVFKGTSNYGNGDAYIYLDDVVVEQVNNCHVPSNLAVSEIGKHSAVLSWTENGEATAWNLKVNGDLIENVTNPYTLTNLIPETEYKVQVCPVCEVEKWSDEITFTTDVACPAPTNVAISNVEPFAATVSWNGSAENYNLRYRTSIKYLTIWEDDFENGLDNWTIYTERESPNPEGWDIFDATYIAATNHSGSYVASSWSWSNDAYDADNWLITPQLDLQGVLKFWEFTNSGYPDSYEVLLSTTGNSISDFTITLREMQEATGIWSEVIIDLSSYVGQKGYIAIHHVTYDANYLFIDDFGIYSSEAAGEWIEVPVNAATTYTIQNLDDETQYDVQVQAVCGGEDGVSVWVDGGTFTTPSNCGAPTNLAANDVTVSSATLSWEGFHDSYNLQYRTAASREPYYFNDFNDEQSEGWTWSEYWIYGYADPIYNISGSENYFMQMGWNSTAEETIISCELPAYESGSYVEFYYFGYQVANTFQVGYSTTTNDAEAFTWGDPIDAPLATYTRYQETLADGVKYVAFKATASSQNACVFIDDFGIFGADIPEGAWQTRNAVTSPYSITGLADDTKYEWQVQGINRACEGGVTEWSNMADFTTLNACMVPVIDSVNNVEATTATVYWTGNQESYNVRYGSFETATSINFNDGVIPASMTNDDTYPWTIVDGHIQSGNAGVASSTSSISFTTTLASDGVITFDAMFRGEGSGQYIWDKCIFSIDGTQQFSYGAVGEEWYNMAYIVAAGTHTFTWSYSKDSSTDPEGDFFAIDNIKIQLHNDTWTTVENVAGNSYDMTGLAPESVIAVQVQGVNDVCDGGVTEWSSEYLFITPEQTLVTQTIALAEGWNWVSFYVEADDLLEQLEESLGENGLYIWSNNGSIEYDADWGWDGDELEITNEETYLIQTSADCTIQLQGLPANPTEHKIYINPGWNWIGYPNTEVTSIEDALVNFDAEEGDQLWNSEGSSEYDVWGWDGDVMEFVPNQGYMYYSVSSDVKPLVFAAGAAKARKIAPSAKAIQLKEQKATMAIDKNVAKARRVAPNAKAIQLKEQKATKE